MRWAIVILSLAAIGVLRVQMIRIEKAARSEIQRLDEQQVTLNRAWWDQDNRLAIIKAPHNVQKRAEQMALDLVAPESNQKKLASHVDAGAWKRK